MLNFLISIPTIFLHVLHSTDVCEFSARVVNEKQTLILTQLTVHLKPDDISIYIIMHVIKCLPTHIEVNALTQYHVFAVHVRLYVHFNALYLLMKVEGISILDVSVSV